MLDKSGNVLKNGLTAADLATYSSSTDYLSFTNNVFPSEDTTKLLGVFYSQHGKAVWVPNPSLDGTHPVVFSAWDSHANFPTADIYIDSIILTSAWGRCPGSRTRT